MHVSRPSAKNYKKVCEDLPDLAILTKSTIPGKVQFMFGQATTGNKSPGEPIVAFALVGYLISPSISPLKIDIDFAADGDKIHLPITEFLLRAAVGNLA